MTSHKKRAPETGPANPKHSLTGLKRANARLSSAALRLATQVVDASPDTLRFGFGKSIRTRLLSRDLDVLVDSSKKEPHHNGTVVRECRFRSVLLTRELGTGGVESVVATLALGLPRWGVQVAVMCQRGGRTAEELRSSGVSVAVVTDVAQATRVLGDLGSVSVAQLHNAPSFLVDACIELGIPIVPVLHTTDINLSESQWESEAALVERGGAAIAVSETVRGFFLRNSPGVLRQSIVVIPNGVAAWFLTDVRQRESRHALEQTLRVSLADSSVFLCLARYDLQKNIPGLVSGFLAAAEQRANLHLVVAGPVEDWLEVAHADSLRRRSPAASRVHLLGMSSSRVLLGAADAFVLDSFFEGWPVAATEAAMLGLPLVMSDVGGAAELIGPGTERGHLVPNPGGEAVAIDLRAVRSARATVASQRNRNQLCSAVLGVHDAIDEWRARRPQLASAARTTLSEDKMLRAHSEVLLRVASGGV